MDKVVYTQKDTYEIPEEYLNLSLEEIEHSIKEDMEEYLKHHKPSFKPSSEDAHLSCYDRMLASKARADAEYE